MNTGKSRLVYRKTKTLSLRRRSKYKGLSHSSSVESMAQIHPPHVKRAEVTEVLTRVLEPKRFVYMIEIQWSDGTTSTSYRSYSEFFDFQCSLLVEFPIEGGSSKGSVRTIPYLPGKKLFQKSTYELARERKPQIHEYVSQLLTLPDHVSKGERVLRFFKSNWQEDRLRSGDPRDRACDGGSSAENYSVRYLTKGSPGASKHSASMKSNDSTGHEDGSFSHGDSEEAIVLGI